MSYGPDFFYSNSLVTGSVAASTGSVILAARNDERNAIWIFNDSSATMYVKVGPSASFNDYSFQLQALAFYESTLPCPRDEISAVWTAATGSAKVTVID